MSSISYFVGKLPREDCRRVFVSRHNLAHVILEGVDDGWVGVEFRLGMSVSEQVVDIVDLTSIIRPLAYNKVSLDGIDISARKTHLTKHMMNWIPAASAC